MFDSRRFAVSVFTLFALYAPSVYGASIRASSSSSVSYDLRQVTYADYGLLKLYLPGTWTTASVDKGLNFTSGGKRVRVINIAKDQCAYQVIRANAQKLWGGGALDQSKSRIQNLILGRSTYRGFSWILPGANDGEYHWCLAQDNKNAVEVSATSSDQSLLTFISQNFVRQLAVRSAR